MDRWVAATVKRPPSSPPIVTDASVAERGSLRRPVRGRPTMSTSSTAPSRTTSALPYLPMPPTRAAFPNTTTARGPRASATSRASSTRPDRGTPTSTSCRASTSASSDAADRCNASMSTRPLPSARWPWRMLKLATRMRRTTRHYASARRMPTDNAAAWDRHSSAYQQGAALPTDVAHYGPDIPTEADLRLLGDLNGKRVLELGCGGAQ